MPERLIGVLWDSTTGPRVIKPDPLIATLYQIVLEQQQKIVALCDANDALMEGLKLKDAEIEDLRAQKTGLRRSLLSWLGGLER